MRRLITVATVSLTLLVGLVAVAAGAGAGAQDAGTVSGPRLTPNLREVSPGQRIDVIFTGWTARYATLSICGNRAERGSADCNMIESTGVRLSTSSGEESPVHDMVVAVPPTDCPCVIRAVGGDNGEIAIAPIELLGHPVSAVVDPDLGQPLIEVGLETEAESVGFLSGLRRWLGGATTHDVTVTVRNLSQEPVAQVAVHGWVHRSGDSVAEFDLAPGEIGPGQTWRGVTSVRVPAPVIGELDWEVAASGAGPVTEASTSTRAVPWLLVVLVLVLVADIVALLVRSVTRSRTRSGGRRAPRSLAHLPPPPAALAGPRSATS